MDEPLILATLTQADIDMMAMAARRGVIYINPPEDDLHDLDDVAAEFGVDL